MIISSSLLQYNTSDIKRALDTKITELSNDGMYDFLPFPSYDIQSPHSSGPFWKNDVMLIKWNYSEPLNNLIPKTDIYLMNGSKSTLLLKDVPTKNKNIHWKIPQWTQKNTSYYIRVESKFDNEIISDVSPTFTINERSLTITSKPPKNPIVANRDNQYTIEWRGLGTSDIFRIELVDVSATKKIELHERLGHLVSNTDENEYTEILEINEPENGDFINSDVLSVIDSKYISNTGEYTWNVNDLDYKINSAKIRVIDLKNLTVGVSDLMQFKVPHINIDYIGRQVGIDALSPNVLVGQGDGDALLNAYAFTPTNFTVLEGQNFEFSYSTTNSVKVYLTKKNKINYSVNLPLSGKHTIENITEEEIYILNAQDSYGRLKSLELNIKIKSGVDPIIIGIYDMTLLELLQYSRTMIMECQTSGEVIISPDSPVNSKISFYSTEISQLDENSSYSSIWYLLLQVKENVLIPVIEGVQSPKVISFASAFKTKLEKLNKEIYDRNLVRISIPKLVSGKIVNSSNEPISGVKVSFDIIGDTYTDVDGQYEMVVYYNYGGSCVAYLDGLQFNPAIRDYANNPILDDTPNQDYVGVPKVPDPPPPDPTTNSVRALVSGLVELPSNYDPYITITYDKDPQVVHEIRKDVSQYYSMPNIKGSTVEFTFSNEALSSISSISIYDSSLNQSLGQYPGNISLLTGQFTASKMNSGNIMTFEAVFGSV